MNRLAGMCLVFALLGAVQAATVPPIWEPAFGAPIPGGAQDDDGTSTIVFGFLFPFQGTPYAGATVSSNGFLQLGGSDGPRCCDGNVSVFLSGFPTISPFWLDLFPPGGGAVRLNTFPGRAVITWDTVPPFEAGAPNTFQMQLLSSGRIIFGYVQADNTTTSGHDVLIGVTPGGGAADPGSTDYLTALPVSTCAGTSYDFIPSSPFATERAPGSKRVRPPAGTVSQFSVFDFQGRNIVFTPNTCGGWDITPTIPCPTITVSPATIPTGTAGTPYGPVTFMQTGGAGSPSFSISSGTLPMGLTLSPAGVLSGIPTQTGSFPITVRATDSNGCTGERSYTLVIACPIITVSPSSLSPGTAGVAYPPVAFMQTGAVGGATFSITSGVLPTGMTLSPAGVLSGTPTQTGSFPITVTATDSNGCTGSRMLTLVINCPTITVSPATTTLPPGSVGIAYVPVTFTQTGGIGTVTFSRIGAIPAGMTLSSGGVLSGTPASGTSGTFVFTVVATDSNGCTGSRTYTLVIGCPAHTIHGHVTTLPPTHTGTFHQHHGVHGHTITFGCVIPPHVPGHSPALTGEPLETLDFPVAVNDEWEALPVARGSVVHLFGSAADFWVGDEHDQPATSLIPSATGKPLYYTTALPEVRIAGIAAKVVFSGLAPGLTAVWQLSVIVPEEAPPGRAPVAVSYEGSELRAVDVDVK